MPAKQELSGFVRSTFRSVWTLELLCVLRKDRERAWSPAELVTALRGSNLVVAQGVESLLAAGLVITEADGSVRYQPASSGIDTLAASAEALYAQRPDAVRRMIVAPSSPGLTGFADAFKLWRD